jgi:hypothetical protein
MVYVHPIRDFHGMVELVYQVELGFCREAHQLERAGQ